MSVVVIFDEPIARVSIEFLSLYEDQNIGFRLSSLRESPIVPLRWPLAAQMMAIAHNFVRNHLKCVAYVW